MTITGPDARTGAPGQAVVDAAMLVLDRMGLTPADLLTAPVFSAAQDVHDGDVRGGHVDPGIPGIWRRVGGHGGGDLVRVSRRGEQLAAVSVAGPVEGMAVPGTGGR